MEIILTIIICVCILYIFYKLLNILDKHEIGERISSFAHKGIMPVFSGIFLIFGGLVAVVLVIYGPYTIYEGLCELNIIKIIYGILEFIFCLVFVYVHENLD